MLLLLRLKLEAKDLAHCAPRNAVQVAGVPPRDNDSAVAHRRGATVVPRRGRVTSVINSLPARRGGVVEKSVAAADAIDAHPAPEMVPDPAEVEVQEKV